jgi:predicted secreted Zn-dependent protease
MVRVFALGLTLLAGLAGAAAAADQAAAPQSAADGLAALPNTMIRYYDVEGRNVTEINRSMARQRPKGRDGKPIPSSTNWSMSADFERTVTDGKCRITAAKIDFQAEAELPRLVDDKPLEPEVRKRWGNYVGLLEDGALTTLAFVHHNVTTVEKAILASSCEGAKASAANTIERLRVHTARMAAERDKQLAQQNRSLSEFRPGMLTDREKICKDVAATGSRLRSFRICLAKREWDRLNADGEKFTQEIQNQSASGKYFGGT